MKRKMYSLLLIVLTFSIAVSYAAIEVKINDGNLLGDTALDKRNNTFYRFKGIPYAEPPVGTLRYKAPRPVKPWNDTRDALNFGNICFQNDISGKYTGSDDCLYLNVYTPKLPTNGSSNPNKTVMVWVHGGALVEGSGNDDVFGPQYLLAKDIVLVTFNYRLNALGFLMIDDPKLNVPGNAAMKDMVMALKWVQKNIKNFGGNPNDVTIFGESAGSLSVTMLVLSSATKGLFHRAIAQSGSGLCYWGKKSDQFTARALVSEIGFNVTTDAEALKILETEPLINIWEATDRLAVATNTVLQIPFSLVVERTTDEQAFLTKEPIDILKEGSFNDIPLIIGYNNQEGILSIQEGNSIPVSNADFQRLIPRDIDVPFGSVKSVAIGETLDLFYIGADTDDENITYDYINLQSDRTFIYQIYHYAALFSAKAISPTYLYRFTYDLEINFLKTVFNLKWLKGASHADDLGYLFYYQGNPKVTPGSYEDIAIDRMTSIWTTFAKTGNPNIGTINATWIPFSENQTNYIHLDVNITAGTLLPERKRIEFWHKLYEFAK